jgi:Mrp family chromosome partitioning ATPase
MGLDSHGIVPADLRSHCGKLIQRLAALGSIPGTLGITSCASGEGVSTVALSLAVTATDVGVGPVLLIDANWERPTAHRFLGVKPGPGLAEFLADPTLPPSIQPSPVANLSVLTAGSLDDRSMCAWPMTALGERWERLKTEYRLIVVDMAPSTEVGFAIPLALVLDGILLVVEADRVLGELVHAQKELLVRAGARLLGVVVNKQRNHIPAGLDRFL